MRNYHLAALVTTDLAYRKAVHALQTKAIKNVGSVFNSNMNRVLSLVTYPGKLLKASKEFSPVFARAEELVTGKKFCRDVDYRRYMEMRPQILAACLPLSAEQIAALQPQGLEGAKRWEDFLFFSDATISACGDYLAPGAESILSSMAVGTWTAFETLGRVRQ